MVEIFFFTMLLPRILFAEKHRYEEEMVLGNVQPDQENGFRK